MCGICGIVGGHSEDFLDTVVSRMKAPIKHRGPDEGHQVVGNGFALGHQRLRVIDLSLGKQPMQDASGRYTIVFNGEIYNFQELRHGLESKGYRFKTRSDTEVLLYAFIEEGTHCLERLNGMFAFAVWDAQENKLFGARDRMGKKPFYYACYQNFFLFASEIKSLLQYPGFPRTVRPDAVSDFFAYTYVPYPKTIYEGIFELPPASWCLWQDGQLETGKYWRPDFSKKFRGTFEDAKCTAWEILKDATRSRLISDVPLGVFLSGGIDSSIVAVLASEISTERLKTFCIGFDDAQYDERPFARRVAKQYQTAHHEFLVRPEAAKILPKIVWHYDQPYSDSSALPSFYVSEVAKQHVTVILNGDGGDESFCGYLRMKAVKFWNAILRLPKPTRALFGKLADRLPILPAKHPVSRLKRLLQCLPAENVFDSYLRHMIQFPESLRHQLLAPGYVSEKNQQSAEDFLRLIYSGATSSDELDPFFELELSSYLPCDLLTKMDRATMAYGLEGRSPFLDYRVVEFAASLPTSYKLRHGKLKFLLKEMMKDKLPSQILNRPKWGFGVPVSSWFRKELKDYARDVLLDPVSQSRPYFQKGFHQRVLNEHWQGREDHGHRIWSLLVFELWHRTFIDRVPDGPLTLG